MLLWSSLLLSCLSSIVILFHAYDYVIISRIWRSRVYFTRYSRHNRTWRAYFITLIKNVKTMIPHDGHSKITFVLNMSRYFIFEIYKATLLPLNILSFFNDRSREKKKVTFARGTIWKRTDLLILLCLIIMFSSLQLASRDFITRRRRSSSKLVLVRKLLLYFHLKNLWHSRQLGELYFRRF